MISRLRSMLVLALAVLGLTTLAGAASAQVVFEVGPSSSGVNVVAHNQYLTRFTVSSPVTITGISQRSLTTTTATYRFVIANRDTAAVLFSTSRSFAADTGVPTYKKSDRFTYTLQPGTTYSIGGIADQPSRVYVEGNGLRTQNNVSSNGNDEFTGSTTLARSTTGFGMFDVQLFNEPTPVPTLSEWAMILLGLTLAGGATLMIQRRRLTA